MFADALFESESLKEMLVNSFEEQSFVLSGINGEVVELSDIEVDVCQLFVIEIKDGLATFDVDCDVHFRARIEYEVTYFIETYPIEEYDFEPYRTFAWIDDSTTLTATVEVEYDPKNPKDFSISSGNFAGNEVKVEMPLRLRDW